MNRTAIAALPSMALLALPDLAAATLQNGDGIAFGTGSPAYAAVRWLWFLAITGVIGAVAFRFFVAGIANGLSPDTRREVIGRAAHVGLVCAAFALAAAGLRLMAQAVALLGGIGPDVAILITGTAWGSAWLIHTAASAAALAAFTLAGRAVPGAWALAALAVPALAAAPSLSGHAAAVASLQPIPIIADSLHVLAAGGWIGGLLVLFTAGLPATRSSGPLPGHFDRLVSAFSPLALACAAILLATGAFASIVHLRTPSDLVATDWGRLLVLKLLAVAAAIGFGARNFLRLKRRLLEPGGEERLRRSAMAELTAGAILLLVTAFLVGTSTPSEAMDMAGPASVPASQSAD